MEELAFGSHFISFNSQRLIPSFLKILQEGVSPHLKGSLEMSFPPMVDKVAPWVPTRAGLIGRGGRGQPPSNRTFPAQGQAPLVSVIKEVSFHEILILFFSRLQVALGTGIFGDH
jgi:hypothetical protein